MNPFERWDDWEWERAAQEIGRDYAYPHSEDRHGRKKFTFRQGQSRDFTEILNGSQKRVILSALMFLTVVFSSKGEDMVSRGVLSVYKNGMDSGNLYTSLNAMAKEAMGVPNQESTAVNKPVQGLFYPPVAGSVKVGFQGKSTQGIVSKGIEIESALGTPVLCPKDGVVQEVSETAGLGRVVKVNFGNGWEGVLGNLGEISVKKGDPVSMGMKLGTVGVGGLSQKPWLYLELLKNGSSVNPLLYLIQGK